MDNLVLIPSLIYWQDVKFFNAGNLVKISTQRFRQKIILIPTRIVRVNLITMSFVQPTIKKSKDGPHKKNKGRPPHQTEEDQYKQQHNNSGTKGGDHSTRITSLHWTQLKIWATLTLLLQSPWATPAMSLKAMGLWPTVMGHLIITSMLLLVHHMWTQIPLSFPLQPSGPV